MKKISFKKWLLLQFIDFVKDFAVVWVCILFFLVCSIVSGLLIPSYGELDTFVEKSIVGTIIFGVGGPMVLILTFALYSDLKKFKKDLYQKYKEDIKEM